MEEKRARQKTSRRAEDEGKGLTSAAADVKLSVGPKLGGTALRSVIRDVPFR
jgi:hypothetical protein